MRKSVLLIAALAGASYFLRRSRKFGPLSALVLGGLLEEVSGVLRNQDAPKGPPKPSLWTRLTTPKPPAPEPQ